jgi:hypothetical protein
VFKKCLKEGMGPVFLIVSESDRGKKGRNKSEEGKRIEDRTKKRKKKK